MIANDVSVFFFISSCLQFSSKRNKFKVIVLKVLVKFIG